MYAANLDGCMHCLVSEYTERQYLIFPSHCPCTLRTDYRYPPKDYTVTAMYKMSPYINFVADWYFRA